MAVFSISHESREESSVFSVRERGGGREGGGGASYLKHGSLR